MTIGYWAPLRPARTGVAAYAAALLDAIRADSSVVVNSAGDVALYQIGNNQLHREIYHRALADPGVVILHDAVLHHFFLGSLDEEAYAAEFVYNYGDDAEVTARRLWSKRSRSGADPEFFDYPLLRRVAERSLAIIVHNPAAAGMVRAHAPGARVYIVPHLFAASPPPASYEVARLRARLAPPDQCLFAVFGHLREAKRIPTVVRAFAGARKFAPMHLLIAGDFVGETYRRAVEPMLDAPGILTRPRLADDEFRMYRAAVDACISLRYPSAGETSGITVGMMGIGKTVLVTDSEENDFPAETGVRVSAGVGEQDELTAQMVRLATRAGDRAAIGANAASFIAREHNPARVARAVREIVRCCYDESSIPASRQ